MSGHLSLFSLLLVWRGQRPLVVVLTLGCRKDSSWLVATVTSFVPLNLALCRDGNQRFTSPKRAIWNIDFHLVIKKRKTQNLWASPFLWVGR